MIEAIQLTEKNIENVADWCNGFHVQGGDYQALVISTLEGEMRGEVGDFIIRGVQGEFYPCREEIFMATYEDVL